MQFTRRLAAAGVAAAAVAAPLLSAVPANAVATYPVTLTISSPASVVYGHAASISGRLTLQGAPFGLSGETVELRQRASSSAAWTVVATHKTGSQGGVTFALAPKHAEQVDLYHPADAFTTAGTSTVKTIKVAYEVNASAVKTSTTRGSEDTITVAVSPSAAGATVTLQRLQAGKWVNVATHALNSSSAASIPFKVPGTAGKYSYRVTKTAAAGYLAGLSKTIAITVS